MKKTLIAEYNENESYRIKNEIKAKYERYRELQEKIKIHKKNKAWEQNIINGMVQEIKDKFPNAKIATRRSWI